MDDRTVRRIFIAFLAMILGAALGGGLVMFCARPASSQPAKSSAVAGSAAPAWSTPERELTSRGIAVALCR